jgi:hypothetical protein
MSDSKNDERGWNVEVVWNGSCHMDVGYDSQWSTDSNTEYGDAGSGGADGDSISSGEREELYGGIADRGGGECLPDSDLGL